MGTVIDRIDVTEGGWRTRHSALHLAVAAAKSCLHEPGETADDVDLLINAGIYRDRNLAEPALAALIQEDVGANPEDPHRRGARHVLVRRLQRNLRSTHRTADRRRLPEVAHHRLRPHRRQ